MPCCIGNFHLEHVFVLGSKSKFHIIALCDGGSSPCFSYFDLVEMWQWLPSSKDSTFMILKKQRQQKTDTKGLTVRHCNFFSCSNSLRLPVNYDTTSKNIVAHSTFEHLEHHNISKIVILPHKSHVSHKYKCMNDGFLINQHADQKNFVHAEHNSM